MSEPVRYAQTRFTSGEFSPKLEGQTGFDLYYAALKRLRNGVVLPQGPVQKRGGMQWLEDAQKQTAGGTRLIEFVVSEDDAMVIEVDTSKIRFWKNGAQITSGGSPYELAAFITDADELFEMQYAQEGNTLYLVHPNHFPRRLRRTADDAWELTNAPFLVEPNQEVFDDFNVGLTLSATSGVSVTVTAASGVFQNGDVTRFLRSGGGFGVITAFTSSTEVTLSVLSDFAGTSLAGDEWELFGTPRGTLTFSGIPGDPLQGRSLTLTAGAGENPFRASDVGRYIAINDGLVRITAYTSANEVDGIIISTLTSKTNTEVWTLYRRIWASAGDYPASVTFHQQRLIFGGAAPGNRNRNRIMGSRTSDFTRFDLGADDDDALSFTLGGDANAIRWIESSRDLLVGTAGDERSVSGAQGGPITPSSVDARIRTRHGGSYVRPAIMGNEVVFVQRSRKVVRGMVFSFQEDTYRAGELSYLADHIPAKQVREMALQEDPDPICWMVLDDGKLAGMTYLPGQNVLGWHLHNTGYDGTDGVIESVAVIPGPAGDEVWVVVRRDLDGSFHKTVERINDDDTGAYLDGWVKVANSPASTSVSGLPSWMNGLTVSIRADGAVHPDKNVSGGAVTLDYDAETVYVGLPYTTTIEMLEPEGGSNRGNSQGMEKRCAKVMARVIETGPFKINGDTTPFRRASQPMGAPPPLVTGDVYSSSGVKWEDKGKVLIESDLPLPLTLVMLAMSLETNMK